MVAYTLHVCTPQSGVATYLAEVARVVLVKHDPVVVLASSVTTASWVLPVLADAAMAGRDMSALLAVLAQAYSTAAPGVSGR